MQFSVTLPDHFGTPVTSAEVVYLRDVARSIYDASVPNEPDPTLRGVPLSRRSDVREGRTTKVLVLDVSGNTVARLVR